MSTLFKLIGDKKFVDNEWRWTYLCISIFIFNQKKIRWITITEHYQKEHPEITNELILNVFQVKLNGERREPRKKHGQREVFVEERVPYDKKRFRLVFWFKDGTNDHLWIRNCHPQD